MLLKNNCLFILLFFGSCFQSKDTSSQQVSAIHYQSYGVIFKPKGNLELTNGIKIAFYKNLKLYRITTTASKAKGSGDEAVVDLSDNTGEKIYSYYVIKNGAKSGLVFSTIDKSKTFERDKFLFRQGLNFKEQQPIFSLDLGKPDKIDKNPKTNEIVYFSESIHPVSFQTVQPDQGFFFLTPFHLALIKAA